MSLLKKSTIKLNDQVYIDRGNTEYVSTGIFSKLLPWKTHFCTNIITKVDA